MNQDKYGNLEMKKTAWYIVLFLSSCFIFYPEQMKAKEVRSAERKVVSLDGVWEIAEGSRDTIPADFSHTVAVPGLADMAEPSFTEVGTKSNQREAFWYRKTFTVDEDVDDVALLKIHKANYGARVFLNQQLVGESLSCFTPLIFDVKKFLRGSGQKNELLICVGADREGLPKNVPDGWDFEKVRYIPGIYDSVELILSGTPHLVRVQVVPDIDKMAVGLAALIQNAEKSKDVVLHYQIREAAGKKEVAAGKQKLGRLESYQQGEYKLEIPIPNGRLWSPDDPFLYELVLSTEGDSYITRFGLRSFRFDKETGHAVLNNQPFFMRGTNICIYRFFEDSQRGDKPWRKEWARQVLRRFKEMNWNSIRYCIGFPPEIWYEVADEEGFLIQDEFPIWYLDKWPAELQAEHLVGPFTDWMRERWNHPCVVIWDAQNETSSQGQTIKAIEAVRSLDLSNRPWDNGWDPPQGPTDSFETHPYPMGLSYFNKGTPVFRLENFARIPGRPGLEVEGFGWIFKGNARENQSNQPIIINEYGWLWLNRDGTPTTLSKNVYAELLGPDATVPQLRETYARYLAAMTEFWRCHRECAAVLHFCGLGYSRPDGQTSDHFLDLESLELEPHFKKIVGDAFSPVGLMIDDWAEYFHPGEKRVIPVIIINDLYTDWSGKIQLRIQKDRETLAEEVQSCSVKALGKEKVTFELSVPQQSGAYKLIAERSDAAGKSICSIRDFKILSQEEKLALQVYPITSVPVVSSIVTIDGSSYPPEYAVDADLTTRWSSEFSDPQWITLDLGEVFPISKVKLTWETAYAKSYFIQVSKDNRSWEKVYHTDQGDGGVDEIVFDPREARYVRLIGLQRGTEYGYSLFDFRIFR